MGSPRHLWTGPWREHSERAREESAEAAQLRQPERPVAAGSAAGGAPLDAGEPDAAPRPPRAEPPSRLTLLLGIALVAAAIAGGAFAAGMLVDGSRSSGPTPLPAVASQPIKPHSGQSQAGAIYAAASPAVVSIRTDVGEGTGFLIDKRGTLVTNDHVVENASHVLVRFGQDGNAINGDVLGADPSSDLAVVSIDPAQIPRGARPLRFADSRAVQVGELVVAIGNPFGLDRTATQGIVSGLGRSIQSPNGFAIDDVIQTDAPINPGNSGGPLLDAGARVVGINQQIETNSGANDGVGFAVPISAVKRSLAQLREDGSAEYAYMGVSSQALYPQLARKLGLDTTYGGLISEVVPGGPAEKAGLEGGDEKLRFQAAQYRTGGDVILAIDGHKIVGENDLARVISSHRPGDKVSLELLHQGKREKVELTLGKRPETPSGG